MKKSRFAAVISELLGDSLRLRYRILLYFVTAVCIALALLQAAFACFPESAGIVCYALAAVTLTVSCCCIAIHIRRDIREIIKPAIAANPYTSKMATDYWWRTVWLAVPGMVSNIIFAVFNGVIAVAGHSAWFGTLSAYYILLSIMRAGVVRQERKLSGVREKREHMNRELALYRRNSILFIFMAVVLAGAVILLLNAQGGKDYPGFTIYAAAAYAFYKIITSTIQVIQVGKRKSPLLSITKRIGYIDACVSVLALQTAMFTAFADGEEGFARLMNGITGTAVCLMVFGLGIQGACFSAKSKADHLAGF